MLGLISKGVLYNIISECPLPSVTAGFWTEVNVFLFRHLELWISTSLKQCPTFIRLSRNKLEVCEYDPCQLWG